MRYLILTIIVLIYSFFNIVRANTNYALSVDESITDNVYLRIINTDSDSIYLAINIEGVEFQPSKLEPLLLYFLKEGVSFQHNISVNNTEFILKLPSSLLDKTLNIFRQTLRDIAAEPSYVDIFILGKVNQQKILGKVYSKWSKLKSSPAFTLNYNFRYQLGASLKKNKDEYWSYIFALLMVCKKDNYLFSDILITETDFYCTLKDSPSNLSAGDIANQKSDVLQWVRANEYDFQKITPLIMSFRQEQSSLQLSEFFASLDAISIEKVSSIYHQVINDELLMANDKDVSKPATINFDGVKRDYITLIPSDNQSWTLSFYLPAQQNICELINCNDLTSSTNFTSSYSNGLWLNFGFASSDKDKNMSLILDEVIKPLNIAKGFANAHLVVNGPETIQPLALLVNEIDFFSTSANLSLSKPLSQLLLSKLNNSETCVDAFQFGSQFLASQIITQYYWQYLAVKNNKDQPKKSIELFEQSCNSIAGTYSSSFEHTFVTDMETFSLIRNAILQRILTFNEQQASYLALSSYYKTDPIALLKLQLEYLTFEEYQYFSNLYVTSLVSPK